LLCSYHLDQTQFVLDKTTVKKAKLVHGKKKNYQSLNITLKSDTAKKLSALAAKNIDTLLTLIFNKQVISRATIQSSLDSTFQIMGITEQEAKLFLQGLPP
jgi:preprotein translocase subunit SecD